MPRRAGLATVAAVGLVCLQMPALFTGDLYTSSLLRDEQVPAYWQDAARAMDAAGDATRVYETPSSDFAYYRWGGTVDPITPGLIDRPYVARELVPYGGAGTTDLLNALEGRLQIGTLDPKAFAPVARLMGVGTVATRNDLQFERFVLPLPRAFWQTVLRAGLGAPRAFGDPVANVPDPRFPLLNEQYFNVAPDAPDPPPVALLDVPDPRPIDRAIDARAPLVVAGSGEGLVDAAEAGLLDPDQLVVYSASVTPREGELDRLLDDDAELLVTDSNRRASRRWGGVQSNLGYTQQAGETPLLHDPQDNALDLFPGTGDDSATVAELSGVSSIRATRYGNPVSYTNEDRPANALDGDPLTAWRSGAFVNVRGQRLRIELDQPVTTDRITLLQPITGSVQRYITQARLRFDDDQSLDVPLDERSRSQPGQVVDLGGQRTFKTLEIEVTGSNDGTLPSYGALPGVGFAEVGIDGVRVGEVLRLPTDLLAAAGTRSAAHDLTLLLTRSRIDPATPNRTDPELSIARTFSLPTARAFTLGGTARVSGVAADTTVDTVLRLPAGGASATASGRLPGDPRLRGASAIDGDPATAWTTPLRTVVGQQLTVDAGAPVTVDRLDLQVVADGQHSVPTALSIVADGGTPVQVKVPAVKDSDVRGAVATVPVDLPSPLHGRTFVVGIDAVREVTSPDYFSSVATVLPVAIAELGLPGVHSTPPADELPTGCRSDLVTVDGQPVGVRLVGTATDAVARQPLAIEGCQQLDLGPGEHVVRTAQGRDLGLDVDQLVLRSQGDAASAASSAPRDAPDVEVVGSSATSITLRVGPSGHDSWLVLGQSYNEGWKATTDAGSLGEQQLVNGYANGWRLPAHDAPLVVHLHWAPQRVINAALLLSVVASLLVLVLAVGLLPRSRRAPAALPAGPPGEESTVPLGAGSRSWWICWASRSWSPSSAVSCRASWHSPPRCSRCGRSGGAGWRWCPWSSSAG